MDEDPHTMGTKLEKSLNFDGELGGLLNVFNGDLKALVERKILKLMN